MSGVEAGDGAVGEDSGFVGWVGENYVFVSIGIGLTKGNCVYRGCELPGQCNDLGRLFGTERHRPCYSSGYLG